MNEAGENRPAGGEVRRLQDVVRDVKNEQADRDDVVVEMREAQRTRLELLAQELAPVFAEIPDEAAIFDVAISSGAQPRLWIDAVSHVAMGRDRRTYRFLRDTRLGRVVLAESPDIKPVAEQVSRYIAERLVERERMMAGDVESLRGEQDAAARDPAAADASTATQEPKLPDEPAEAPADPPRAGRGRAIVSGLLFVVLGGLVGVVAVLVVLRDRLPELASHLGL